MIKKASRFIVIVLVIFLIGGIGGVFFDRFIVPKMSSNSFFSGFDLFKKANENVTIINKTEQIVVREDKPINEIASGAASSIVTVLSVDEDSTYKGTEKSRRGVGVVITSDGIVMTYKDLIFEDVSRNYVYSRDGKMHEAEVVGVDDYSNLIFLKVENLNLPAISLANSDDLVVGQKLIAIGSFSYENQAMFTVGHFEGINKTGNLYGKNLSYSDKFEGVLETDIADLSDYVGGPVVNYNGELVGLTGKGEIDEDFYYFQIPANIIKESISRLINNNGDHRAALGVYYLSLSNINSKILELETDSGAYVYSASGKQGLAVISGLAGQKAGIRIGDVIVSVNGEKIDANNPLPKYLNKYKVGDTVKMIVIRNGEEIELDVVF